MVMIFLSILILIVSISLPNLKKNLNPILLVRISSIVFMYAGVLSYNTFYIQSIGSGIGIYSGLFQLSNISASMDIFILIVGSLVLSSCLFLMHNVTPSSSLSHSECVASSTSTTASLSKGMLVDGGVSATAVIAGGNTKQNQYFSEYALIVLFTTLGACLLVSSSDLISMYLSIELQSFAVYILSTLYKDSESSTSAGLKYYLLGGLSSCFILLGSGLVYSYTGLTQLEGIYSLISSSESIYTALHLGFVLIIVGFLFKIAAAPFHQWAPDVYNDTPTIVTIWLSIMPKISILLFLLELYTHIGFMNVNSIFSTAVDTVAIAGLPGLLAGLEMNMIKELLLITSLLSLIIGSIVGLGQNQIKRLLAYSTISHVGFILLSLAINTEQSIDSLLFYIVQYSLTNLNTFLILIAFGLLIKNIATHNSIYRGNEKDIKYISELKGQFYKNPLLSLSLSICLFSMAGIPPLIGFFSKQFVLYSAIQSGYYFMAIVAIIVSIISASYYLKIIKVLHTNASGHDQHSNIVENTTSSINDHDIANKVNDGVAVGADGGVSANTSLSNMHTYVISSLSLIILFFILKPSLILSLTQLLSLSLFNY